MHNTAPIRTLKLRTLGQGSTRMGDQLGAAGIGINSAMRRVDSEEFGSLVEVPMLHWKVVRLQTI